MNVKAHRMNAGMSVAELAKRVGVKPGVIYHIESAGGKPRDMRKAKAIADVFGVAVIDLWPIEDAVAAERRADMLHDLDRGNSTIEDEAA